MKLKTSIHVTRVLHVEVPEKYQTDKLQLALSYVLPDGQYPRLKDGVQVDAQCLEDLLDEDLTEDASTKQFLKAAQVRARWVNADEYFFHI